VQQDAGLEAAAAAEGVTGADEADLDGSFAHTPTLPWAAPSGDDDLRWNMTSTATSSTAWRETLLGGTARHIRASLTAWPPPGLGMYSGL
jgi:hypothetical protein